MKPIPLSDIDRERLLAKWEAARQARETAFGYFRAERERIESAFTNCNDQMRAWSRHVNEILYAEKDATYNLKDAAEKAADTALTAELASIAETYAWLGKVSWLRSWVCGFNAPPREGMLAKLSDAYLQVLQDWFRVENQTTLSSQRAELNKKPLVQFPEQLPIGALVWGEQGVYRVTRRTHNGKRTLAIKFGGSAEERLLAGRSGDGYFQRATGYRRVSVAWAKRNQVLQDAWLALGTHSDLEKAA